MIAFIQLNKIKKMKKKKTIRIYLINKNKIFHQVESKSSKRTNYKQIKLIILPWKTLVYKVPHKFKYKCKILINNKKKMIYKIIKSNKKFNNKMKVNIIKKMV